MDFVIFFGVESCSKLKLNSLLLVSLNDVIISFNKSLMVKSSSIKLSSISGFNDSLLKIWLHLSTWLDNNSMS